MQLAIMENDEDILDLAKAYISAEKYARKFYKYYPSIFKRAGFEVSDLIQESQMVVTQTINKYDSKPVEDILKLSSLAVGWHLKKIRYRIIHSLAQEDLQNKIRSQEEPNPYKNFRFEDLNSILTPKQFHILSEVIRNNRTFQSLSEEYDCSREYIRQVYNSTLLIVKKYLNIT